MRKILGLDLGTTSIGWALVKEAEKDNEQSEIIKLGVRVNPLSVDEKTNFEKGKPLSTNADRTLKRGARRNLQRYKLRRQNLIEALVKNGFIKDDSVLTEVGKGSTHQTSCIRAIAAREKVSLEELARIFLIINKKRGYKSSRKVKNDDEGISVDGMAIAKYLYDNQLTPGQYVYNKLKEAEVTNKKAYLPDFYSSDLKSEFDAVWNFQKQFYSDILDAQLYKALEGQGQQNSRKRFLAIKGIYTAENKGKRDAAKLQHYKWRNDAIKEYLTIEEVAYVLVEINNNLNKSSGYLGAISDRSKELYFGKITVGELQYNLLKKNPHTSLKNQVFYRQDYLDEFEQIWETQSKYYPNILSVKLKEQIRDIIIFYQRKLKSQKGLISFCQFEQKEQFYKDTEEKPKVRTIGPRVSPKSSPLFQEFKIWQNINILQFKNISKQIDNDENIFVLTDDDRKLLFDELNLRGNLSENEVLTLFNLSTKEWKTNLPKGIEGNRTNQGMFNVFQQIANAEGYGFDWTKKKAAEIKEELNAIFLEIGVKTEILNFNSNLERNAFDKQMSYQLWHLLYSAEDDSKISKKDREVYGNSGVILKKKLHNKFGFKPEYASWLSNVTFQEDYGSLSTKAMRKIIPHLQDGSLYNEACTYAGYNHSDSITKEENEKRELKEKLELLPKNSLRNPVVEKILNQMVNVVNLVIDTYGKPDEIRIELARDLKKSAKEREASIKYINAATKANDEIRKIIRKDFGFAPTKNDVVRYKLYEELKTNGYKTLFTNEYIGKEKIFSKNIDIEHIIPKAILFDDSFSNKTLAFRKVNLKKADRTAFDFISSDYNLDLGAYLARVESLYKAGEISKGKYKKLLMPADKLPTDFIERDLRNSQYIAKKAKEILQKIVRNPIVSTSGRITDKLREDWDLINVMKELNFPKYKALGLTEIQERKGGRKIEIIKDWTKRNDHRHHAMDALTVAFTTHNHIQYINNLNASRSENSALHKIKSKITKVYEQGSGKKKRKFIHPIHDFRTKAKEEVEDILISFKNKNKVVTKNINKTKAKGKYNRKIQLTPRGQLHKETVYAISKRELSKPTTLTKKFTIQQANLIIDKKVKALILFRLNKYDNLPSVAFDTKTIKKDPIIYKEESLKSVKCFEEVFTIRKDITPDLKVDKVVDEKIKTILRQRINTFGNAKKAFSDLDKNPIWLNQEKGISIKRVTISGVSNAEALHYKKNHFGKEILNEEGEKQAVDFVSTGNNHHVAIYIDKKGNLQEQVVSFYEAVARVNAGFPIVDRAYNESHGWQFKFTMKQNEMFVFPSEDFNPNEIDLTDDKNAKIISKQLFRIQKISTKNYMFTHHLETMATTGDDLKYLKLLAGKKYHLIQTPEKLKDILKVRINHIGKIVQIGEY